LVNDSEVAVRQQGELVFVTLLVKNSTETTQFQIVRTTKGER
jgi:hypothetical protein